MEKKEKYYKTILCEDGKQKYKCLVCERLLASKQNICHHLHVTPKFSPVKRTKKVYKDDVLVKVPKRTQYNWKKQHSSHNSHESSNSSGATSSDMYHDMHPAYQNLKSPSMVNISDDTKIGSELTHQSVESQIINTYKMSSDSESLRHSDSASLRHSDSESLIHLDSENSASSDSENLDSANLQHSDSESSIHFDSENSLQDSTYDYDESIESFNDNDSLNYDTDYTIPSESDNDSIDETFDSFDEKNDENSDSNMLHNQHTESILTDIETQAMNLLACFLRNSLSSSTCKDILKTMKKMFPDSQSISSLDYDSLWRSVEAISYNEVHYCTFCYQVFPINLDEFRCASDNCAGLRYKGNISNQTKKGRSPQHSFILADVKQQLKSLLNVPGIWEEVQKNKHVIKDSNNIGYITDITDGKAYRKLLEDGQFLSSPYHLSAIFNTDGVNLYSSSKIELWPIFLAINELSSKSRFSRYNMLLAGIWQGAGKPPFEQYMGTFSQDMNMLYTEGLKAFQN